MYAATFDADILNFDIARPFDEALEKVKIVRHRLTSHRRLGFIGRMLKVLFAAL